MTEKIHDILAGLALIVALFVSGVLPLIWPEPEEEAPQKLHVELTAPSVEIPDVSYVFDIKANYDKAKAVMDGFSEIREAMDTVTLPTVEVELTDLGTYYITGYTSVECGGSTMTASGATCHKASSYNDSFINPTTCAIDPALHDFGDLFFIEGFGCYVAEDTGSAVKGKHLDLYFWDSEYNYALSITGYYKVYAVEIVYGTVQATKYDIQQQVAYKVIGWKIKGA